MIWLPGKEASMAKKTWLSLAAILLLALLGVPRNSHSARRTFIGTFLPPNDMRIPVGAIDAKGITREQYDAVMDRVEALYASIVQARGAHLVINRLWDDPTVNASAEQRGSNWIINMYGGLARHETITQDGMALVACHELGHHIGGAPKYDGMDWASNEGESDYFANAKCLHRVFASPGTASFTRMATDNEVAATACAKSYAKPDDQKVCLRSAMAGYSVTSLFRALRREDKIPHFDTPDSAVVSETYDGHPGTQCRLDTYFQGSLCAKPYTTDMDNNNPAVGACVASQGYSVGLRPLCWYKPGSGETPVLPRVAAAQLLIDTSASLKTLKDPAVWQGQ